MNHRTHFIWGLIFLTASCSVGVTGLDPNSLTSNNGNLVSFKSDIVPMFSQTFVAGKCIDCHTGSLPFGNLNLNQGERSHEDIYDSLMNEHDVIDLVSPENSLLLARPSGSSHIELFKSSSQSYMMVRDWIYAGAPFDDQVPAPGTTPTPVPTPCITPTPVPTPSGQTYFNSLVQPLLNGCLTCHNGVTQALDMVDPNPLVVCANLKNQPGVVIPMDTRNSKLISKPLLNSGVDHDGGKFFVASGNEIEILAKWINTGAPCN